MQTREETKISVIRRARMVAREAGVPLYSAAGIALAVEVIEEWRWSRTTIGCDVVLDPGRAPTGGC